MWTTGLLDVLAHEGPASIVTAGTDGAHVAATWNSYIAVEGGDRLLIPAGSLNKTEKNIKNGSDVQVLLASKEVMGTHGLGAGFLICGTATFEDDGLRYESMKTRFPWARSVMVLHARELKQLI